MEAWRRAVLIPRPGGVGAAIASSVACWLAVHGACFLYPPLRRTGRMLTRALVFPRVRFMAFAKRPAKPS